jgi:ribose transport system permease protein
MIGDSPRTIEEQNVASITKEVTASTVRKKKLRFPPLLAPLLVLITLVIVFTLINPRFLSGANIANLLRQSSILVIVAMGETFIILMGSIDLSIEGVMALSSVVIGLLAENYFNSNDLGLIAVAIAVLAGTAMGFLNGFAHTKLRIPSFMATLGMMYVGLGLATWLSNGMNLPVLDPMLLSWARGNVGPIPNLTFFGLAIFLIALFIQRYTRFGRYVLAIGGAEDRAKLAGIPIDKYKILAFTLAGLFVGMGGVLNSARIGAGAANSGLNQLFAAITAVVVGGTALTGGTGGVVGTLIGAVIVTVISNGMLLVGVPSYVQPAVYGVIITIGVILTIDRSKLPFIK